MALLCRIIAFLLLTTIAMLGASSCQALIPANGAYDILRTTENSTFQQFIEEYVYEKNFSSHDEALKAGLSVGAIVYGVPLKVGGTFSNDQRTEWRRQYESRRKVSTQSSLYKAFEQLTLNVAALKIIANCITATESPARGVNLKIQQVDDCHFVTTLRYFPTRRESEPKLYEIKAYGGVCQTAPVSTVPNGGASVQCYRTWREAFAVFLNSSAGEAMSEVIDPLPEPGTEPRPPKMKTEYEGAATKVFSVQKNDIYYPSYVGAEAAGDGGRKLQITVEAPGPISDVTHSAVGEGSDHIWRSGLVTKDLPANKMTWVGWTNDGHNQVMTFTITYAPPKEVCESGCNYEKDHEAWLKATGRNCGPGH